MKNIFLFVKNQFHNEFIQNYKIDALSKFIRLKLLMNFVTATVLKSVHVAYFFFFASIFFFLISGLFEGNI